MENGLLTLISKLSIKEIDRNLIWILGEIARQSVKFRDQIINCIFLKFLISDGSIYPLTKILENSNILEIK